MGKISKKLFKTKNSTQIDLDLLEDIKIHSKKAQNQENGSCATLLGIATCGLSWLVCPCLLCIP